MALAGSQASQEAARGARPGCTPASALGPPVLASHRDAEVFGCQVSLGLRPGGLWLFPEIVTLCQSSPGILAAHCARQSLAPLLRPACVGAGSTGAEAAAPRPLGRQDPLLRPARGLHPQTRWRRAGQEETWTVGRRKTQLPSLAIKETYVGYLSHS